MSSVDKRFQAEFAPLTLCWAFPLTRKHSSVPASVKATLTSLGATHLAAYISPFGRACESLRSFGERETFNFRYCKANHESYLEAPFGFAPCNNGTAEPGPKAFRLRRGSLRKRLLPQASIRTPTLGKSGSLATPRVLLVVACYGRHAAGGEASWAIETSANKKTRPEDVVLVGPQRGLTHLACIAYKATLSSDAFGYRPR